jgi:hypothetical protein
MMNRVSVGWCNLSDWGDMIPFIYASLRFARHFSQHFML